MSSIPPLSSASISSSSTQQAGPIGRNAVNSTSQDSISSLASPAQREIKGNELLVKSAIAGTLGVLPFAAAKVGQLIVNGCAFAASKAKSFIERKIPLGNFLEYPVRAFLGIPAAISSVFFFGGAVLFSKTQALVWGQDLVEHPQEERVNTKLARYGASDKPKSDFWQLLGGFFMPFNGIESSEGTDSEGNPAVEFGFSNDINQALVKFSEFSPN